jgi:predicted anti-sigma-YlaC factor YlaD
MMTDQFTLYDAAYVLGALSPTDRREFEDHLQTCEACANAVGELAGLPGRMSRMSIDQLTAEPEPVPETLLPSLARAVRRRRARRRFAVAMVGISAGLVVLGAVAISRPDSPAQPPVTSPSQTSGTPNLALTAVVPSPITASARLVDTAWGTRVELTCIYHASGLSPARKLPYALVLVDRHGATEQLTTWKSLPNSKLVVMGASARGRGEIGAVEVQTLDGRTILRLST